MKDQERLKKIDDLLESYYASEDGFEQTDLAISIIQGHVNWLKQQAEEKQELEERFEILSEQHDLALQQNKRYEKAFRRIKRDYAVQNVDYIPVTALYEIQLIIDQALQNNREG